VELVIIKIINHILVVIVQQFVKPVFPILNVNLVMMVNIYSNQLVLVNVKMDIMWIIKNVKVV